MTAMYEGRQALTNMQHNVPLSIVCLISQEWYRTISILISQVPIYDKPRAPVSAILEDVHCEHLAPV